MNIRKLKFRVWDIEEKHWIDHSHALTLCFDKFFDLYNGDRLIFQQFTGLVDKNGREIYDGDIVNIREKDYYNPYGYNPEEIRESYFWKNSLVYWVDSLYSYCVKFNFYRENESLYGYKYVEVVGNILENPELINI